MILRFSKLTVVALIIFAIVNSCTLMPKESIKNTEALKPPLPFSAEAERSVLGAVLLDNDAMLEVLPAVREDDFFLAKHKKIYRQMTGIFSSGKKIDSVTLTESLSTCGELDAVGGPGYLIDLLDGLPRVTNVKYYAEIVAGKAQLRNLVYLCEQICGRATEQRDHPNEIIEDAVEKIMSLAFSGGAGQARIREWNEATESALREVDEARKNPKSVCRINSGIASLDEITSGLRKKEISLIVGATSHGKSLLAEEFAVTADDSGYKGMIFSAEMSAESIVMRQLSYESDVFLYHLRRPDSITTHQLEGLSLAAKRERQLSIVDSGITPERIWVMAEARKRAKGLDFIIVDYDQLVIGAGIGMGADPDMFFARQGEFIIRASEFAKRLDVAFILLAQPRKMPSGMRKGEKPTLDDIYGHSAMRNTPHVILWIVREFFVHGLDEKYERKAKVYVLKSRNDRTGHADLEFDSRRVRFLDKKSNDQEEV